MPGWSITGFASAWSATTAASRHHGRSNVRIAGRRNHSPPSAPASNGYKEEAAALFPDARSMVLSSDLITSIETMRAELTEIAEGRVDLIIGTQLVAKGHHFPRLNLVGVIDARFGARQW